MSAGAVAMFVAACFAFDTGSVSAAEAAPARIVAQGTTAPLPSGGSGTKFGIALPAGAHCPGDTEHKGYRVWSYLVPGDVELRSVSFAGLIPEPGYPLKARGDPFGPANTAQDTGQIVRLPNDFVLSDLDLTPAELLRSGATSASWHAGIACSDVRGALSTYWNVDLVFSVNSGDPAGYTWVVSRPVSTSGGGSPSRPTAVVVGLGLAGGLVLLRRSRQKPTRAARA
jgi:MYXO-CTERM domain-containing protein